jgi:hypothetical protein
VNKLYRKLQEDKDLKDNIKLIGIGAANSPFEVDFFRKKYEVGFPLFPDEDRTVHEALGEVRTPYFIGVKIHEDGSDEVIYSKLGGFKDHKKFLNRILKSAGLK